MLQALRAVLLKVVRPYVGSQFVFDEALQKLQPPERGRGMLKDLPYTIAVIGTGFSGTATAIHLLRGAANRPLRLILIERGPEFARGIAYARTKHPYLLNVPASRMSATTADPTEFLRFAQRRNAGVDGEDFLPRALYGDYLQDLLQFARTTSSSAVHIEQIQAEIVDLSVAGDGKSTRLVFATGGTVEARNVVFALGNPPPRLPGGIRCSAAPPVIKVNPWSMTTPYDHSGPILIIGTGLTMVDVVTATLQNHPNIAVHAISRHGLVPPSQSAFSPDALDGDGDLLACSAGSIRRLVAAARRLGAEALSRGGDWREVVTLLRRQVPALWSALPLAERARFLRHVRTYWEAHRHRIPANTLKVLREAQASQRFFVHAGRLRTLDAISSGARATWVARGSDKENSLEVAEVINCSGPDYDVSRSAERLWQSLLAKGLTVPDDLSLGIRTRARGALVSRDGSISSRHFYIGPMLRADHWEATAVGELRTHAEQLAAHLTTLLSS